MFEYFYFMGFQMMLTLRCLFRWRRYLNYNPFWGLENDIPFQICMMIYTLNVTMFVLIMYPILGIFPEIVFKHLYGYMTKQYILY
jgi:hypothetical protein